MNTGTAGITSERTSIAKSALQRFGINADLQTLTGYEESTFLVDAADGRKFILRISNDGDAPLALQIAMVRRLRDAGLDRLVPEIMTASDNQSVIRIGNFDTCLFGFLPGSCLGERDERVDDGLIDNLGEIVGRVARALESEDFVFDPKAANRQSVWDLTRVLQLRDDLDLIDDRMRRSWVDSALSRFETRVLARLGELPHSLIHGDLNDWNLLVADNRISGLIDFGDARYTATVFDLAIAAAYVIRCESPIQDLLKLVGAYHRLKPLSEVECEVVFYALQARLCTTVLCAARMEQEKPGSEYHQISAAQAWRRLELLHDMDEIEVCCRLRHACGYPAADHTAAVYDYLQRGVSDVSPVIRADTGYRLLDMTANNPDMSPAMTDDSAIFSQYIDAHLGDGRVGIGRYLEDRQFYTSDGFDAANGSRRTVHLGIDLFAPAATPVYAPLAGCVHSIANNQARLDYGPTIILEHTVPRPYGGGRFFTLFGHLSIESLSDVEPGQVIAAGVQIATLGAAPVNGDWPAHLHFQLMSDMLGRMGDFPGVASAEELDFWRCLCLDPNLLLRLPVSSTGNAAHVDLSSRRNKSLGPNLSVSYATPLKIVRGAGARLYDDTGRAYLDMVNNVCHVGHCHPRVVEAAQNQIAELNTNTRYLHDTIVDYADQLTATFPDPLNVCFFVCSGSEANELALRIAKIVTGRRQIVVLDHAYHGNTGALVDISPYKYNGPGGNGPGDFVSVAELPDRYRGRYGYDDPRAAIRYAADLGALLDDLGDPQKPAAFIAESYPGCAGQIILPDGYCAAAFERVRKAGGLCIADEVQVGFGRAGSHFWAFETQDVVPDIVTLGKPMGNGHPLAAVVTTREIADAFANGMEFFSTFGGNPVSCAVGLAVLDVIKEEDLQKNARVVGDSLMAGLQDAATRFENIGDVRGHGLFIGVELVSDRKTKLPAAAYAEKVVELAKDRGILLSTDGPHHNVIKIKPPLVFDDHDAGFFLAVFNDVLALADMHTVCGD